MCTPSFICKFPFGAESPFASGPARVEPLALADLTSLGRRPSGHPAPRHKPMANRSHTRSAPIEDLRRAIDCLPEATRRAMLEGVQASERIIAGAYVDGHGGVCPMLVAHRRGARTNFLSFARAWDRFTRARRRARTATRRELDVLIGHLQNSLMSDAQLDLTGAIA